MPDADPRPSRGRLSLGVLIILAAATFALLLTVVAPFVPGLTWAFTFAIAADPLHRWLRRHIPRASLAAAASVLIVAVALVVPATFVIWQISTEARRGFEQVTAVLASGQWEEHLRSHPTFGRAYSAIASQIDLAGELRRLTTNMPQQAGAWVRTIGNAVIQLLIAMFALFFFFRDRRQIIGYLRSLMPLSERETDYFFQRVRDTTHATIYGTVFTALVQGGLGGLMFFILGIPGAVLWGAAMAVLSLVPSLGSFVIWIPAAIVFASQGAWVKAVVLAGWGVFVVGTIDNVLYPMLVGSEMRMHTLPVFVVTIGGLVIFGAAGIVLGPIILAATVAKLEIFRRRTRREESAQHVPTP